MRRPFRILAGLLLGGALTGCTTPAPKQGESAPAQPPASDLWSGQELAARLFFRDPLTQDERLLRYVNLVGRAAAFSLPVRDRVRVGVTQSGVPYAAALPGGIVIVSRGAIMLMTSEAELATFLAREFCREASGDWSDPGGECGDVGDAASESLWDACGARSAAAAGYDASAYLNYLESLELRASSARERLDLQWRIETYRNLPELGRGGVTLAERFRRSAVS
jgi:predicted Zn-dependent protease